MSSDFIKLSINGIPEGILVDKIVAESLPSVDWQFMGGRVVAVLDQDFVGMIDLANFIGGSSCFTSLQSPWDYRLTKLCKLKLTITLDGTLEVSVENIIDTFPPV